MWARMNFFYLSTDHSKAYFKAEIIHKQTHKCFSAVEGVSETWVWVSVCMYIYIYNTYTNMHTQLVFTFSFIFIISLVACYIGRCLYLQSHLKISFLLIKHSLSQGWDYTHVITHERIHRYILISKMILLEN